MEPVVYLYDGTFAGMLHAIARAVKDGGAVHAITPTHRYTPTLFDTVITLKCDADQADRLLQYLQNLHPLAANLAVYAYLSGEGGVEMQMYSFVHLCLRRGKQALSYESHSAVAHLKGLFHAVSREAHRYKGLIRFRILADDLQYGPFEPHYNIISLCARHFKRRLAGCRWLLHDLQRNSALYWDTVDLQPVEVDTDFAAYVALHGEVPAAQLSENEQEYQQLWRAFHRAISNPARHNPQLQQQGMPQRYWKYLTEM